MLDSVGQVDRLRIAALINNSPKYNTYLKGCNGISLWLEISAGDTQKTVLFDVGPVAEPLLYNAEKMGLRLSDVDVIVLSHCHFDHTAALAEVVAALGHEVTIVAHPEIFRPNYVVYPEFMHCGLTGNNRREHIEGLGGRFVLSRSPLEICPGVLFSGEVERITPFEDAGGAQCFTRDSEGNLIEDRLKDDASVVVNVRNRGIVVVTGCAHAGPVNTLEHSIRISGARSVEGIIGGFHLLEAGEERVALTIEEFKKYNPRWIAPMHCTGLIPSAKIAMAFGARYREINAGDVIEGP